MGGTYKPRPRGQLEDLEWPAVLGQYGEWDIHVHARASTYRGQTRDFAITVWAVSADGRTRYQVECIDCCEGELHRHRLALSEPTDRQADRHRICDLNSGDEATVHKEFDMQYDWVLANWESVVRRWATT